MSSITKGMHNVLGVPLWTPAMPKSYKVTSYKWISYKLQATSYEYYAE